MQALFCFCNLRVWGRFGDARFSTQHRHALHGMAHWRKNGLHVRTPLYLYTGRSHRAVGVTALAGCSSPSPQLGRAATWPAEDTHTNACTRAESFTFRRRWRQCRSNGGTHSSVNSDSRQTWRCCHKAPEAPRTPCGRLKDVTCTEILAAGPAPRNLGHACSEPHCDPSCNGGCTFTSAIKPPLATC